MPHDPAPKDRFDDLADTGRRGAHRAENPRSGVGRVVVWSAAVTVVLIAVGIAGVLLSTGAISLAPQATAAPPPTPESVLDTSYDILVLNASGHDGLATEIAEQLIAGKWTAEAVSAGDAAASDFATTTVYYPTEADAPAARSLADEIGGADLALSDAYLPGDDPATEDVDESAVKLLVIVVGQDRVPAAG